MVHPHKRGDNKMKSFQRFGQLGSPPQAWGQFFEI